MKLGWGVPQGQRDLMLLMDLILFPLSWEVEGGCTNVLV